MMAVAWGADPLALVRPSERGTSSLASVIPLLAPQGNLMGAWVRVSLSPRRQDGYS